jgi:ketosteroid isomerase-like protein
MAGMAQTFADALRRTEESGDPEPLVQLFAEGCELRNLALTEQGLEGARRFWQTYLAQFDRIRSEFSRLIEQDGQAALVWTSEGAMKGGHPIAYRGVSIIETQGDKVRRFETVYDSAAFLRPETTAATDR